MRNQLKIRTFKATIEPILLYGSECWNIDALLKKKIDGCYTRLLRMATNTLWKAKANQRSTIQRNAEISEVIRQRRLQLAGHCIIGRSHRNSTAVDLAVDFHRRVI